MKFRIIQYNFSDHVIGTIVLIIVIYIVIIVSKSDKLSVNRWGDGLRLLVYTSMISRRGEKQTLQIKCTISIVIMYGWPM